MFDFEGETYIQFKLSLDTVKGHFEVEGLHQKLINKIINSVILQLVLQLVFSSVASANSSIHSTV